MNPTVASANIKKYGTGKDVDIICMDNGTWIGHIEFINNRPSARIHHRLYRWKCFAWVRYLRCFILVHDASYYIDPRLVPMFQSGSRLETRWDGTTVITESEARQWWGSASNRSVGFQTFGTVQISSYTRLRAHGDYNTQFLQWYTWIHTWKSNLW